MGVVVVSASAAGELPPVAQVAKAVPLPPPPRSALLDVRTPATASATAPIDPGSWPPCYHPLIPPLPQVSALLALISDTCNLPPTDARLVRWAAGNDHWRRGGSTLESGRAGSSAASPASDGALRVLGGSTHARGEPGPLAPHRGAVVPPAVHANARQRLRCSRHPLSPQARSKRRPPRRCCRSSLPHCPPSRAGSAQRKTPPRWVGVGSAGGSALQPRCSSKGLACNRSGLRRYDPAALPMRTSLQQRKPATLRTRARGPTPSACSAKVSQLLPCCGGSAAGCKSAVLAAP